MNRKPRRNVQTIGHNRFWRDFISVQVFDEKGFLTVLNDQGIQGRAWY
jgi:hypothetical protein